MALAEDPQVCSAEFPTWLTLRVSGRLLFAACFRWRVAVARRRWPVLAGAQAVGGAVDGGDDAAVEEAVEGGGGARGVAEPLGPGRDADVGGGDDAALEVAGVDDLEEQGAGFLVQDPVADLVDDQEP